ncbi:DUF192 domain-containing protein [Halomonas urumqiensis]|uniref:DUF192 domain-containing protein n=1 Tax=Halomonas urumqiensis TaxID=1684789 RepID=A0A2N7UH89_9GAMM|nr:DUF192 domain-containing protein [Halomonas urumqiensis]PMR79818.1 hypothetical protein C1H70_10055 [Halomonas urumqiensis]PTB02154.1 DUF192 domain-containing protein [Halomonas urumqiensis]GHE21611.1 hypothetical protein GCM10017767_21320 [Halomonas urumqiensis]
MTAHRRHPASQTFGPFAVSRLACVAALGIAVLVIILWPGFVPQASGQPLARSSLEVVPATIHAGERRLALDVEVARTSAERSRGLMGREHLDADAGMLFLYDRKQAANNGFWMYRTLIPLDIAFLDEKGRIVALHSMVPCGSERPGDCPVTTPGVPYQAALEVNAGYFAEHTIGIGDCVSWAGANACKDTP